ncbi:phosphate acyltransferase PlsX [Frigidibacter sp. ROC022]|uniref:phosphate acyltransferase PlsX n=1 Tax=Frigidibacter sp. ROC022 TaxID=2971796 RepID=UPI00215B101E|nr:phosphate acyltransferase PlsX [Frigidibacter sp. ROC022]MCR8723244.1 phosphate acyltransferase PlsX [Frigidibacter sp. ROC022]
MATAPSDTNTSGAGSPQTAIDQTVVERTLAPAARGREPSVISVDAMGGDLGPAAVVGGVARAAKDHPDVRFLLFGHEDELSRLIQRRGLADRVEIRHAADVITMDVKPSHAMRRGKGSSMWAAIDAVAQHEAGVCVSCGNTGALMAVSMLQLRKIAGVHRPAIACLWPCRNPHGFNVMLDAGADISADETDLFQYALMGVSYARNGLGILKPRVGLLNVGTEEHKGRSELKLAHEAIGAATDSADFEYIGFVEGRDLPSSRVDVIVTDGFTGNVALKTAEGTAGLFRDFLTQAFKATPLSRIAALLALTSLKRLQRRIDPRRVNGGVFLGLNGTVVKSHGGADATGVAAAIDLAIKLDQSGFNERLAARVASHLPDRQASPQGSGTESGDSNAPDRKTQGPEPGEPSPSGRQSGGEAAQ